MAQLKTRKSRGAMRPVAGREQIIAAARSIGARDGWKAVTIRAVAQKLGYTSPLLYEHFRDKEELLTELAIDGQLSLAREITRDLPPESSHAIQVMVERYWSFMLKNKQIYRLMNGMDGVPIERRKVARIAQRSFQAAQAKIEVWLTEREVKPDEAGKLATTLIDELWALLHGMAALYLDRSAKFDRESAGECVNKLLMGTQAALAAGSSKKA